MLTEEQYFWLELVTKKGLSPRILKKLFDYFGSARAISQANKKDLKEMGVRPMALDALVRRPEVDLVRLENIMQSEDIGLICISEKKYPALLREIPDPPPLLFYKGSLAALESNLHFLAVVGSRNCSLYARKVIARVLHPLSLYDFSIISGFAYGVDTLSHRAAIEAGMPTIAVLGSGISKTCLYPAQNRELAKQVVKEKGILLSEFLPWQRSLPQFFVQRNRIIAGLSRVTLIVEAAKKSGALVTAEMALSFSRDVAAVPGSIFSKVSFGTNRLLSNGAALVQSSSDILRLFNLEDKTYGEALVELSPKEKKILELLQERNYSVDELVELTNFTIREIHSIVSLLELNGLL